MKWHIPTHNSRNTSSAFEYLITANMQGGCRAYQLQKSDENKHSEFVVSSSQMFPEIRDPGKHLSYGVDLITECTAAEEECFFHNMTVASCSFYEDIISITSLKFPTDASPVNK